MEVSTYFMAILRRGGVVDMPSMLLSLGTVKVGEDQESVKTTMNTFKNLDELHRLVERLLFVNSWEKLFQADKA